MAGLGEIGGATEEVGQFQVSVSIFGVLPDASPERAFLSQSLLNSANYGGEERTRPRPTQVPRQLSHGSIAGDAERIGAKRLQILAPRLVVAAQPLQRLCVQIAVLGVIGQQGDRLTQRRRRALETARGAQLQLAAAQEGEAVRAVRLSLERLLLPRDPLGVLHVAKVTAAQQPERAGCHGLELQPVL